MTLKTATLILLLILGGTVTAAAQMPGVRMVPIAEGWAKNQINAVIFRRNSITSDQTHQYAAFYNADSKVVIAKRKLGSTSWEIKETKFSGNTADAHNSISIAIDGRGYIHLSWNNHNTKLNYARSAKPGSLDMSPSAMLGDLENKVTYPEFYNPPNGGLLFFYRDGASGNGNLVLNGYDAKTEKWSRIQNNLIDGEGRRNAYAQIAVDVKGTIHVSWVWRESPDVATNHDLCYARSTDGGKTWTRSTGEKYQVPITAATAEYIWRIPQNSELINQTSMAADTYGNPYIGTYWRPAGTSVPQYHLVYFNGKAWRSSQVSRRTTPFTLSGGGTKRIPISRPQVVINKKKIVVIFRDAERGNRVTVATTSDPAVNDWTIRDITNEDLGMWEPTLDHNLWKSRKRLHLFVQKVGQGDGEKLEQLKPQVISILEWEQ
jgi:hypothetical protein